MTVNYKIIGERIREIRKEKGWSQLELAEYADISEPYMSYIETGKKKISLATLIAVATALEVTVDFLLIGNQMEPLDTTEMGLVLSDCSVAERRIIIEVSKAVKRNLREYLNDFNQWE